MYKPSDKLRRRFVIFGAAAALCLLAASISAVAGVIEAERQREAAPVKKTPPVLMLAAGNTATCCSKSRWSRCPPRRARTHASPIVDRQGRALQVIDMASAACLVRSTPAEEYRSEGSAAR